MLLGHHWYNATEWRIIQIGEFSIGAGTTGVLMLKWLITLAHNVIFPGYFSGFGTWGVSTNPWGSLPFSFPRPSPSPLSLLSPSLPFPSLPPFPLKLGGVVQKLGGINPQALASKFSERAFSYAGPAAWNSLPDHIQSITNTASFKRQLNQGVYVFECFT